MACLVLLIVASRRKVMADDNTTGHVWDEDLRELNNPLPRWWMWLFVITVVFAAIYLALYPGLGKFRRHAGLEQRRPVRGRAAAARRPSMAPIYAKFKGKSAEELAKDSAAMGIGERLFVNNCAQCHGSDARGSKGFPNLTDGDWLYGGSLETISETITKGRIGVMPPMAAAVGTAEDVQQRRQLRAQPVGQRAQQRRPRSWASPSSWSAPPATAPTARATRRSARPT